jgi:hypothetical protein
MENMVLTVASVQSQLSQAVTVACHPKYLQNLAQACNAIVT